MKKNLKTCNMCSNDLNVNQIKLNSDHGIKIKKYLPVKKFPINACISCLNYVDEWNTFYENCSNINNALLDHLSLNNNPIAGSQKIISADVGNQTESTSEPKRNRIFKSRTTRNKKFYKCPHCTLSIYTTLKGFNEHLKFFHDSLSHCKLCNIYLPKNKLIPHMTNHAIDSYSNTSKLKILPSSENEIPKSNVKLKKFKCELCKPDESNFSTNRLLRNHMQSCHSNERNYICEICNKGFKTDASLYIHLKSHSNTKPYQCKCGKSYKFQNHLKSHIQQQHLDEKLFHCTFCKKKFFSKNSLTKHNKIHEINDDFKCHICNSVFKQKRYLKEHLRKVHMKK